MPSWSTCTPARGCWTPSEPRRSRSRGPARPRWPSSWSTCRWSGRCPSAATRSGPDRRFLAAYLPEIENYLHYRSVDVSSVKELVRALVPHRPGAAAAARWAATGPSATSRRAWPSCATTGSGSSVRRTPARRPTGRGQRGGRVATGRPFHGTGRRRRVSATERRKITRKHTTNSG